ncbi:MAG: hypothetical protein B7Z55_19680, partial [Planctomycetales bacterium 12-60-4]
MDTEPLVRSLIYEHDGVTVSISHASETLHGSQVMLERRYQLTLTTVIETNGPVVRRVVLALPQPFAGMMADQPLVVIVRRIPRYDVFPKVIQIPPNHDGYEASFVVIATA